MRPILWLLLIAAAALCGLAQAPNSDAKLDLRYWIEPCSRPETHCLAHDPQMAEWALEDWRRASNGQLHFEKTNNRLKANIRIYWASANQGLYGETRAFVEDGLKGADVYVLPDLSAMGREISGAARIDSVLRDAIVYLTCLHETGHALGLSHTTAFADIMYTFQSGGDIPEYFARYRRQLHSRDDIPKTTGTSPQDRGRLLQALITY